MSTDKRYRLTQIFLFSNIIKNNFFKIKLGLIFLIFFFLEVNFSREISLFTILPNLFFILIFFLCLYREGYIFFMGVSLGLLKDLFSISKFPLNTIIFGFWSYFLPKIFKRFYKENILLQVSIFILCTWLNSLISFLFRGEILGSIFLTIASLESLYGVLIYLFLFRFLKRCI